jgi:transposase
MYPMVAMPSQAPVICAGASKLDSGCIATRYDKLAANYLAFIKLASIRLWLRNYESTP